MSGTQPDRAPGSAAPALRASDADRERAAEQLRHAAGDGRLTMDELDDRLRLAYAARTRADLEPLLADIPLEAAGPEAPRAGVPVRPGPEGARWLVAVMSGCERRGRWRVGSRCTVINVMGASDLDLSEAELADEVVEMTVFSLMGGSEIHVPEGLNVELSELALMGGNEVRLGDAAPTPGGPVLRLRIISVMGGAEVRRGPKPSRPERRGLKRHGHGWH